MVPRPRLRADLANPVSSVVRHREGFNHMNFTHYDIGNQSRGTVIEVTLKGSAANVRLLDNSNFQNYRRGRKH